MRTTLIVLALAITMALAVVPKFDETIVREFESLHAEHGRTYALGGEEYHQRLAIFHENLGRIEEARRNDPGAEYRMNKFFDLSREEFAGLYKMPVRRSNVGDDVAEPCLGGGAQLQSIHPKEAQRMKDLPDSFDWRSKPNVVTPVKDQAACGSCWAFSVTEVIESAWALAGKGFTPLAPQQIVDCSHGCSTVPPSTQKECNQGCNGGWPWAAMMDVVSMGGLEAESTYPYTGYDGTCAFVKDKVVASIRNYTCISGPETASEANMAEVLMKQGPLSIAMNAEWWQFYFGGISNPWMCDATALDHAIVIVGFDVSPNWMGVKTPYWIVRNSWGSGWGESGYIYIARGSNSCGIANAVSIPLV